LKEPGLQDIIYFSRKCEILFTLLLRETSILYIIFHTNKIETK